MSYDDAIEALSKDALKFVKNNSVLGLGSGRAATAFVKELGKFIKNKKTDHTSCSHITSNQANCRAIWNSSNISRSD